jgi:hypothetical protein
MTAIAAPWFAGILPYMHAPRVAGDGGRRRRIEVRETVPSDLARQALGYRMPCVYCGREIAPFRARQGSAHGIYFGATCERAGGNRDVCSKGAAASREYRAVCAAIDEYRRAGGGIPIQPSLL